MKLITTLSFLLVGMLAFAQSTSMTIFNNNGQQFFVIMNGVKQNSIPQTNVKIGSMAPGSYEVKLIFADGKTGDINKKIWIDTPGDYLARVVLKGKKRKLQWFGIPEESQAIPAGGTAIEYRPNDQSVYSDQSSTWNGSANGTSMTTGQPEGTLTPGTTTYQNSQATGQAGAPATTGVNVSGSAPVQSGTPPEPFGATVNNGTATGTTTTTSTTPTGATVITTTDANGNVQVISSETPLGQGGTSTTSNTTGQQSTTFGSSATIPDPNIPTGFGVHINITEPGTTTGNGEFGVSTTVSGAGVEGTTSTSTSSSTTSSSTTQNGQVTNSTYNSNTSVTQNGQTTITSQSSQYGNQGGTTTTTGNGQTTQPAGTTSGTKGATYSCTKVMTEIEKFVGELEAVTFEADQVQKIKTDLNTYCVTADQAYRIVNTLTFDVDKMEISKFLYVRMSDKVNGKRLLELLTFDADKTELKNFMANH